MSDRVPNNQIKSVTLIQQAEHEDAADAKRVVLVSPDGVFRGHDPAAPLYVQLSDGSITIGTVNAELEVQLSHQDDVAHPGDIHDSVRVGGPSGVEVEVNDDGSINTNTYERLFGLLVNANFLKLANYDVVTPNITGTVATLSYYESGAKIAQATIDFTDRTNWNIALEAYLNNDDGSFLQHDNDNPLLLE